MQRTASRRVERVGNTERVSRAGGPRFSEGRPPFANNHAKGKLAAVMPGTGGKAGHPCPGPICVGPRAGSSVMRPLRGCVAISSGVCPILYQPAMRRTETPLPAIRGRPPQMVEERPQARPGRPRQPGSRRRRHESGGRQFSAGACPRRTKDADSWQRKIRLYDGLQNQSYPHRFRVLIVTTRSRDRLQHILDLAAAQASNPRRTLFYGTHLSDYLGQQDAIGAPCFRDHRGLRIGLVPIPSEAPNRHRPQSEAIARRAAV